MIDLKRYFRKLFLSNNQDVYGLHLITSITRQFKRPPLFTASALRPVCLAMLINDTAINQRSVIVELGAGVTTLYLAAAIKLYGLNCKIYSVDEDENWLSFVKKQLEFENLEDFVTLIPAPVTTNRLGATWYDTKVLDSYNWNAFNIDSLIIDGPKAYGAGMSNNRATAIDYFFPMLAERCLVYLDDCDRAGEKMIFRKMESKLNIKGAIKYGSGGLLIRGEAYNTNPL